MDNILYLFLFSYRWKVYRCFRAWTAAVHSRSLAVWMPTSARCTSLWLKCPPALRWENRTQKTWGKMLLCLICPASSLSLFRYFHSFDPCWMNLRHTSCSTVAIYVRMLCYYHREVNESSNPSQVMLLIDFCHITLFLWIEYFLLGWLLIFLCLIKLSFSCIKWQATISHAKRETKTILFTCLFLEAGTDAAYRGHTLGQ